MSQNIQVENLDAYLVRGIEFVGLVTKNGRLADYRSRKGLKLSEEQKEMLFMSISLHESLQHDFDDELGEVKYTITERENFRLVSIPDRQGIIVLITKGGFAPTIKKIKDAVNHAKRLTQDDQKSNC